MVAGYRRIQKAINATEKNKAEKGAWECWGGGRWHSLEQSAQEKPLPRRQRLCEDLEEARKRVCLSGKRSTSEEENGKWAGPREAGMSPACFGRSRGAVCGAGGPGPTAVAVPSAALRCALPPCQAALLDDKGRLGRWMSRIRRDPAGSVHCCPRAGQAGVCSVQVVCAPPAEDAGEDAGTGRRAGVDGETAQP